MSARVGLVLLLVVSLLLGIVLGQVFFGLFLRTMPPMAVSTFNQSTAHALFVAYGVAAGGAIFVLSAIVVFLARFFTGRAKEKPPAAAPS